MQKQRNMQQLGRRNAYTPLDAAPVPSSVATWLNSPERVGTVLCGFKTHPNNSEEHLTDLGMPDVLFLLARVKLPYICQEV